MSEGVKVVSLAHIKLPTPAVNAPPEEARRIAWAGGKITSNKEEAMLAFLRRKQKQGGLTKEQKGILQKLTSEDHGAHRATVLTGTGEVANAKQVYGGQERAGGSHKVVMLKKALRDHEDDEEEEQERRIARAVRFGGGGRQAKQRRWEQEEEQDVGFTVTLDHDGGGGGGFKKRRLGPPGGGSSVGGRGGGGRPRAQQEPRNKAKVDKRGGGEKGGSGVPLEARLTMSLDQLMKK